MLKASVISAAAASVAGAAGASLVWTNTGVPGLGEIFEEVSESDLQPGDILLFPLDGSNNIIYRIMFKHAAVYCGDGEVIHFMGVDDPNSSGDSSSKRIPGLIHKSGYKAMKKQRGKCGIFRKKGGVDLQDFRSRVVRAMNSEAEYDAYTNNCIHFALSLLGLQDFYSQLVEIRDEGGSSSSGEAAI